MLAPESKRRCIKRIISQPSPTKDTVLDAESSDQEGEESTTDFLQLHSTRSVVIYGRSMLISERV